VVITGRFYLDKKLLRMFLDRKEVAKVFVTLFFCIVSIQSKAQEIARCIEVLGDNNFKFYFRMDGRLVSKECADYYRIAKLNPKSYVFNGPSRDYYSTGEIAVESNYLNSVLNGPFRGYYDNGQVKEQGEIVKGTKLGRWKYWYENGQVKKVISFHQNGDYELEESYAENGEAMVVNGNGKFEATDLYPEMKISGEIKNGRQHGRWVIYNQAWRAKTAVEQFENGKFIKGLNVSKIGSPTKYTGQARTLVDLTNDLLGFGYWDKLQCSLYGANNYEWKKYNSEALFYSFIDHIYQDFEPARPVTGYTLMGFTIDVNGRLTKLTDYSTIADSVIERELREVFLSSGTWIPDKLHNIPIESSELFIFQFTEGAYRILNDGRNEYPSMEVLQKSAKYTFGEDSLINAITSCLKLPPEFYDKKFNLSAPLEFHIGKTGNIIANVGAFLDARIKVSENEKILNRALAEAFVCAGSWQPAMTNNTPQIHYFFSVINIKNGTPHIRLFSRNWVLE
jgi:antitoxin component YwqK of YwqJK toxin-antitoxin module